jgi:hypothetical protein
VRTHLAVVLVVASRDVSSIMLAGNWQRMRAAAAARRSTFVA